MSFIMEIDGDMTELLRAVREDLNALEEGTV
jgi:hypothetical protein